MTTLSTPEDGSTLVHETPDGLPPDVYPAGWFSETHGLDNDGDDLTPAVRLTVEQLATEIGQTVGATRKLLTNELIPGARRIDPLAARSPWLIPADAPARFLAQFDRRGR
jgi:hypothetical protein